MEIKQTLFELKGISQKEYWNHNASPILKWAGGKSQLLPIIRENYPFELKNNKIKIFIEPFVGGGAVYFDIINKFNIDSAYLFDTNHELVIVYNSVKMSPKRVIRELGELEIAYLSQNESIQKKMYYKVREDYNKSLKKVIAKLKNSSNMPKRAAQTLFLNRTCFNGLFRVNSKGFFNVPHGSYKKPKILHETNIMNASRALQIADILHGDFSQAFKYITKNTFVYYDPPYRPVSKTSSFNSYSKESFDDNEQIRLSNFFKKMDKKNIKQMLSNSDPKNYIEDTFFDDLYCGYQIRRVHAKRYINSDPSKRGNLTELLIKNY